MYVAPDDEAALAAMNAGRPREMLRSRGLGAAADAVSQHIAGVMGSGFQDPDVVWMGNPPARIDLMKGVPGGAFDACFARRIEIADGDVLVSVVGLEDLVRLKEASGRAQDLEDARTLRAIERR